MGAFHGYAHSYLCQLFYHAHSVTGTGLEDFETMERIFSSSNGLASITRYTTGYRRQLLIEIFFQQWDEDKYMNTGKFIFNNYVQALGIINRDTTILENTLRSNGVTEQTLDQWEKAEQHYFQNLTGKEDPWDAYAVVYVEMLQDLQAANAARGNATTQFLQSIPEDYSFDADAAKSADKSQTAQLETRRRHANERYNQILFDVLDMELRMGTQRWEPSTPQYQATVKYIAERKYHRALNKVHRLVVLRLFELHKMNLSQTGKSNNSRSVCYGLF